MSEKENDDNASSFNNLSNDKKKELGSINIKKKMMEKPYDSTPTQNECVFNKKTKIILFSIIGVILIIIIIILLVLIIWNNNNNNIKIKLI